MACQHVEYLVVGAGMSGLSFANWLRAEAEARGRPMPELLIVEADQEPGGYCKTVKQDGFVWDYSGHFFHFKHADIEAWLRARMPGQDIRTVEKRSFIRHRGRDIDFPFQKNIHQLARQDFIDCLVDLYFRDQDAPVHSFQEMLYARFGKSIAEMFLIPYNQKLYACDLGSLDVDAMGRFFPHADIADIIRNMRVPENSGYNATFTYPRGGAIEYVNALLRDLPASCLSLGERLEAVDLSRQVARTSKREIRFRRLVCSAPFPAIARMAGLEHDAAAFSWNRVLVYNLGFDRKGDDKPHWMYFPERELSFYRVGWYDNIMGADRMSLYVEIGAPAEHGANAGADIDVSDTRATLARVLADLKAAGVTRGHELVSWHSVLLDPAYVHITSASNAELARLMPALNAAGVYPVGRYGRWTYCSIEDNIVETRALARVFAASL